MKRQLGREYGGDEKRGYGHGPHKETWMEKDRFGEKLQTQSRNYTPKMNINRNEFVHSYLQFLFQFRAPTWRPPDIKRW